MITIQEINDKCSNAFAIVGLEFKNIPILINGRLTKTLGRCCYKRIMGKIVPARLEFSRQFLETATSFDIDEVIKHECAHAIACIETGERQGHNTYFKKICAKIGTKRDTSSAPIERIVTEDKIYKYFIYCKDCGKLVGKYHRAGKIIKNINFYNCKCGGDLKVVQNF